MNGMQTFWLGVMLGIVTMFAVTVVAFYMQRASNEMELETLKKIHVESLLALQAGHKAHLVELNDRYRNILMQVGRDIQEANPGVSAKGLLQIVEENKPVYLTVKQTLEELLKRCS